MTQDEDLILNSPEALEILRRAKLEADVAYNQALKIAKRDGGKSVKQKQLEAKEKRLAQLTNELIPSMHFQEMRILQDEISILEQEIADEQG